MVTVPSPGEVRLLTGLLQGILWTFLQWLLFPFLCQTQEGILLCCLVRTLWVPRGEAHELVEAPAVSVFHTTPYASCNYSPKWPLKYFAQSTAPAAVLQASWSWLCSPYSLVLADCVVAICPATSVLSQVWESHWFSVWSTFFLAKVWESQPMCPSRNYAGVSEEQTCYTWRNETKPPHFILNVL